MDFIPLDKNESYWLLDDELVEACSAFGKKELSTYPDYASLKKHIADYAGVEPAQICLTAGSDAVIEHIGRSLIEKGRVALLPVPTFYGYEAILARGNVLITPITYTEEADSFVFPLEETLRHLDDPDVAALFLCNPNNPLGISIPEDALSGIVAKAKEKNILLVSDEAYFEYGENKTLLPFLKDMENLLIIRTFSKAFGLSGARVGYCIGNTLLIEKLQTQLLPWPVAHVSAFAASAALNHQEEFAKRRMTYFAQRELFYKKLQEIQGMIVYPSEANFFLTRVAHAENVQTRLKEKGIQVALGETMSRYPNGKELLRNTLRIAVPAPEHTELVCAALQEAIYK